VGESHHLGRGGSAQTHHIRAAVGAGLPSRELRADRDRIGRALTAAARLEAGTVCWPQDKPWPADWEAELLAFPNGCYDDQADVFA